MFIEFKNVNYDYDDFLGHKTFRVSNIDLQINKGDFVLVAGPTGSGKTTFLRLLDGLILPKNGVISIDDKEIDRKSKEEKLLKIRSKIGFVFQIPQRQLFSKTVLDDVAFAAKNFGYSHDQAIQMAKRSLEKVGFQKDLYNRSVFSLSSGQMRKAAIAGSLVNDPPLILFDEPTSGLDQFSKDQLLKMFASFKRNGKTVVVVSHDLDYFLQFSKKMIVFNHGKIIFDDEPRFFFEKMEKKLQLFIDPKTIKYAKKLGLKNTPLSIKELAGDIL
ncbi:energy-coupling factor ABC transporter ATP-binding protein [Oenococcus alcoholitolerans]|uniref:energy-coupling factor ABC transporter ATP-binding protein n=1 Tax=Oenococcus alcoholitolerans TaxID=931074 RepID=UPI003F709D14